MNGTPPRTPILVTGFEPFAGADDNPSARIVDHLLRDGPAGVHAAVLPVSASRLPGRLVELLERHRPAVILGLGEARGDAAIRVERVAVNLLDFRTADNDGQVLHDVPVIPGGPPAYFTTLPTGRLADAVRSTGVACATSLSAGAYLCNMMMYLALHWSAARAHAPAFGFLHLPSLPTQNTTGVDRPSMELAAQMRAIPNTDDAQHPSLRRPSVHNVAGHRMTTITAPADSHRAPAHHAARRHVVVIGGGLAGMAAAVALGDAGFRVTILEARRTLGGRAGSFDDPQTGETLDNCQHVTLGCCTNLADFYRRLGVLRRIQYERTIRFLDHHGRAYALGGTPGVPAPLHLSAALMRFSVLSVAERVALGRAMLAMARMGDAGRMELADVPFGQWLDQHQQPNSLVKKLYDPVVISALNEDTRRASAAYAIQVFQGSLLSNAKGYVVGVPDCPLGELYAKLPGVEAVRTGERVGRIVYDVNVATGVELVDGELIPADAVVLATGHHAARRFVPEPLAHADSRFHPHTQLEDVPILGVHLTFDRPVMRWPHVALIEGPLQWLFRKDAEGRVLHGVISAAREWVRKPKAACLALFERQVRQLFPAARDATIERGVIVIEKRATFSPLPGVDRHRPPQAPPQGGVQNLYLAGDYTQSGWPATMEGAVRSGYLAAEAITAKLSPTHDQPDKKPFLVPALPAQWPYRLARR